MSTAQLITAHEGLGPSGTAAAFADALRDRAQGRPMAACERWARLEADARAAGEPRIAVQAAAQRALTLTWVGALPTASALAERALEELRGLTALRRERQLSRSDDDARIPEPGSWSPPPVADGGTGGRFSVAGLRRLRAEQLRRGGDYCGALDQLERATRETGRHEPEALPIWGRVILSESLRLAGDFDGAHEVAASALQRAGEDAAHPWVLVMAERAHARALLASGELDETLACLLAMAGCDRHRDADGSMACDLAIGETLRRRGDLAAAGRHLHRARSAALEQGQVVGWIHAQLCLAELARTAGAQPDEITALLQPVHRQLLLAGHPWLRLRGFALGAISARGARAEQLLNRAEEELPRFRRRSCDLELERDLVEAARVAVVSGEAPPSIAMDFL